MERQHLSQTKKIASSPTQTHHIHSSPQPTEELQSTRGNQAENQRLASPPRPPAKPMFGGLSRELTIQPKLTIGAVGDQHEQEADRIAANVVQRIYAPQNQVIQREEMPEDDEELQMKPMVQRREAITGGEASTDLEAAINQARGGGQPLDASLQKSMGQAMEADFSSVRVHTDSHANQLNRSIQAKAFTTGQDVFFKQGEYQPGSTGGQELIAHELTHVVQQNHTNMIQRMVLNLDASDSTINSAADIEKDRQQRTRQRSKSELSKPKSRIVIPEEKIPDEKSGEPTPLVVPEKPLWSCSPNEEITILAHGLPAMGDQPPKIAGLTANEMYQKLIDLGWTTDHKGDINLSNCTSAWSRTDEGSFAQQFVGIIRQNGFTNTVTGFRSFVSSTDIDTEIEADYLTREYKLLMYIASRYMSWIGGMDGPTTKQDMLKEIKNAERMCFVESDRLKKIGEIELGGMWETVGIQLINYRAKLDEAENLEKIDSEEEMENLLKLKNRCVDQINVKPTSEIPAHKVEFKRESLGRQRRNTM